MYYLRLVDANQKQNSCLVVTEVYHQFHNGLGKAFPASYTRDLKAAVAKAGKIAPTGCLELPF